MGAADSLWTGNPKGQWRASDVLQLHATGPKRDAANAQQAGPHTVLNCGHRADVPRGMRLSGLNEKKASTD